MNCCDLFVPQDIDLANGDRDRIRKLQKYLQDRQIITIQSQMAVSDMRATNNIRSRSSRPSRPT